MVDDDGKRIMDGGPSGNRAFVFDDDNNWRCRTGRIPVEERGMFVPRHGVEGGGVRRQFLYYLFVFLGVVRPDVRRVFFVSRFGRRRS